MRNRELQKTTHCYHVASRRWWGWKTALVTAFSSLDAVGVAVATGFHPAHNGRNGRPVVVNLAHPTGLPPEVAHVCSDGLRCRVLLPVPGVRELPLFLAV